MNHIFNQICTEKGVEGDDLDVKWKFFPALGQLDPIRPR